MVFPHQKKKRRILKRAVKGDEMIGIDKFRFIKLFYNIIV